MVGDGGLWGVGGRVQSDIVPRLLSSTQILFSIIAQIKHKPTFFLCFNQTQLYSSYLYYSYKNMCMGHLHHPHDATTIVVVCPC